jgi:hypothetical protein
MATGDTRVLQQMIPERDHGTIAGNIPKPGDPRQKRSSTLLNLVLGRCGSLVNLNQRFHSILAFRTTSIDLKNTVRLDSNSLVCAKGNAFPP